MGNLLALFLTKSWIIKSIPLMLNLKHLPGDVSVSLDSKLTAKLSKVHQSAHSDLIGRCVHPNADRNVKMLCSVNGEFGLKCVGQAASLFSVS